MDDVLVNFDDEGRQAAAAAAIAEFAQRAAGRVLHLPRPRRRPLRRGGPGHARLALERC